MYTLFNTHDNTEATADGVTSCSSIRYTHKHTHTLSRSLILKIKKTPRQMEIHHVNQSGTHSYLLFNTHDNTDATADRDKSYSSVRNTHIHTLFNTQDNTDATADGDISCSSVRYTHKHSLFNTQDNTDATADGDLLVHQSGTRIHTLSLIFMIKKTPRQMEMHYIHQSDTRTHTLSLIRMIIQTPRQMELHLVHQSGSHLYTPFNTHDNTDATADGDKTNSSVRYKYIQYL